MVDTGIICKGIFEGRECWAKAELAQALHHAGSRGDALGLASKALIPDHLVGQQEDLGITVALIPNDLPRSRRPPPSAGDAGVPNGRTGAAIVFIPMDYIIAGRSGWAGLEVLMTALAAGRAFRCRHCPLRARPSGAPPRRYAAFATVRHSIGKFEGIEERSPASAGTAYLLDAARRLTCAALNQGTIRPSSPAS